MTVFRTASELGALASYGADIVDMHVRSIEYVDKVLRGAKPGELPIQQPTKYELVINRKRAVALGLPISKTMLARADSIIE